MKFSNTLVVAAHPDDEVLGVGGTIPLIKRQGGRVTVVIVTDGSSTQYRDDHEILTRKHQEARDANAILGTDELIQWDFPDMRLDTVPHAELNQAFEKLFAEHRFDSVFVQGLGDINQDHRLINHSVMVAARPYPGQSVRSVLSYYVVSSSEWGAMLGHPQTRYNVFIDISETIQTKLDAMACYTDELREPPHPRSLDGIRTRAAAHGGEAGYAFAEPFSLMLWHGPLS